MADVLVSHPRLGSLWLRNCTIQGGDVVGEWRDESDLSDRYRRPPRTMNFPVACIRKDPDGIIPHMEVREPP